MSRTQEMIQSHPHQMAADQELNVPANVHSSAIDSLYECVSTCTSCADACLGEENIAALRRCIRLNLDCADICRSTAAVLARQTEPDWSVVRAQLEACAAVCRSCGEECRRHAEHHEHCRVCADACAACEEACNRVLSSLPA